MSPLLFSRRTVIKGAATLVVGAAGAGAYGLAEPFWLRIARYAVSPPGWPRGLNLRLAVIADLHACEPWMSAARIRQIVARTNALLPDATLLLGDYVVGDRLGRFGEPVAHEVWAGILAGLKAPLGVFAVLGNHDWWEDIEVQRRRAGPVRAGLALEAHGIRLLENDAVQLEKDGVLFWIAGLGDQWAFWPTGNAPVEFATRPRRVIGYTGVHDVEATLAKVTDRAPVVLMAHEPDIFAELDRRVALTVSGHTHGGQVRIAGFSPIVPSRFGRRYAYGHIVEEGRNLVVSGGLGCSGVPVRFGVAPEIVLIELGSGYNVA